MPARPVEEQRDYYARRMIEEFGRAEDAEDDGLRHLHISWAREYRRRMAALPGSGATPHSQAEARGLGSWTTDLG